MRVYGIIGWKNAGKTSLMERLVAEITGRGFTVSTVKHVHHDVDLDQPGKDSYRHRAAGASEVVLASAHRFALMREHRGPEPELSAILARMAPVDLVLVEGYKRDPHPKIEVFREEAGKSLIQPDDPLVRAVATDLRLDLPVPVLDLNDTGAVADFILAETGLAKTGFDTVVVVDWSGAAVPSPRKPSADAIWIGVAGVSGEAVSYHRTRTDAEAHLGDLFALEAAAGRRVLAGFDFPLGYPEGFAARLTGRATALVLWDWLAARIEDAPDNRNNRFALANEINAGFQVQGPFWGRPAGLALSHLPERRLCDHTALGLAERRRVELAVPRAQSVWKLYTTGSVGSQALLGLPVLSRLRHRFGASVWPFEPATGPLVLAEIYPSLLAPQVTAAGDAIKDRAQVQLLARALFRLARSGELGMLLDDVPDWPGRAEEGWILGAGHAGLLRRALE